MKFELKLFKLSLDADGVKRSMMPYIREAMDKAEDRFIEIIRNEIDLVSGSPHEWRDILKGHIQHLRDEIENDVIQYYVGPDYDADLNSGLWMRAMVIAFGNMAPIFAGPKGRIVWDDDLLRLKRSESNYHELQQSWYHDGRDYIQNAVTLMRTEFERIIIGSLSDMPASVFTDNIKISK